MCLQSVTDALTTIHSEIIVVDNASSDDSCTMVKTHFPEVKCIENDTNFGFSKGNNIGVAQAQGEYICILNPDTVVAEDTFTKLLQFVESKDDLGIVGCQLIDGRGRFLPESKRNIPYVNVAFKKMIGFPKDYYANHLTPNAIGKTDILVGAFMLLKKEVYNAVGGFDEDYFMYGEDVDISYKILKAGYTNYYYGETAVIHFKGESTLKDHTYAKRFFGAMQLFYKKHFTQHKLFDVFVWLGINLAYFIRRAPKAYTKAVEQYLWVSEHTPKSITRVIQKPIEQLQELQTVSPNTEIIFDNDSVPFKTIIAYMSDSKIHQDATFKIHPKGATFILGSNDSKNRGEVIAI